VGATEKAAAVNGLLYGCSILTPVRVRYFPIDVQNSDVNAMDYCMRQTFTNQETDADGEDDFPFNNPAPGERTTSRPRVPAGMNFAVITGMRWVDIVHWAATWRPVERRLSVWQAPSGD
jgi:hypothetical protein